MPHRNLSFNPNASGGSRSILRFAIVVAAVCAVVHAIAERPAISANGFSRETTGATTQSMSEQQINAAGKNEAIEFYAALETVLTARKQRLSELYRRGDALEKRVLNDYGAIFVAADSVVAPPVCRFADAEAVERFQKSVDIADETIAGAKIELQKAALRALKAARKAARRENLDITPRDGAEAARRSFDDTLRLWDSRFFPALAFWTEKGRIAPDESERLRKLPIREQVAAVLALEETGVFFSKDFARTILSSVAAPGCSQHLSLLAFDANEFDNRRVREILGAHGWFRTVNHDAPHFTFLGRKEADLPAFGLKRIETKWGEYWIPNVTLEKTNAR